MFEKILLGVVCVVSIGLLFKLSKRDAKLTKRIEESKKDKSPYEFDEVEVEEDQNSIEVD